MYEYNHLHKQSYDENIPNDVKLTRKYEYKQKNITRNTNWYTIT